MMLKRVFYTALLVLGFASNATSAHIDATSQPIINQAIQKGLSAKAAQLALKAYHNAEAKHLSDSHILTIIDYTKSSSKKRLWIFDLDQQKLLYNTYVAHGEGSGFSVPHHFSNTHGSHQSSLGLFLTQTPYFGRYGYSLHLKGLERGINDHALSRAIVIHGAKWVSQSQLRYAGHLGMSWGCPAVPLSLARPLINTLKGGSLVFVYAEDKKLLKQSQFLS